MSAKERNGADGEGWPVLDAETRAYFLQIGDRITELVQLGVGQDKEAGEQLDANDERVLIIRGSLASLHGHEIELATDAEASFILERLLYSMDDFARRVLADRFVGQYAQLARNQFACHVLQTLFFLGSFTVERESRGIFPPGPSTKSADLRTMTQLLCIACDELTPQASLHLYDSYSSHLLRSALALLTGGSFPEEPEGDKLKSKRNRKWLRKREPLRSLGAAEGSGKGKDRERLVPQEFLRVKADLLSALHEALGKDGEALAARQAGAHPVALVIVQILLGIEADAGLSDRPDSLLDRLLEGLVSSIGKGDAAPGKRRDYVETLLRDTSASHLLEIIVTRAPPPVFDAIWSIYYVGRLEKLAAHPVSNFTVSKCIERLDALRLKAAIDEMLGSSVGRTIIEKSRTGPLQALAKRAAEIQEEEQSVAKLLQRALAVETPSQTKWLVMCTLGLTPVDYLKDTTRYLDFAKPLEPTLQGSLLAQSWLQLRAPASDPLVESIINAPITYLISLCCDAIPSRMIDAVLDSSAIAGKQKRRLILRFLDHYHTLAQDRIGSRVADRCWDYADIYLQEKVARSLLPHIVTLSGSQYGHHFARKVQLPLLERKPVEWKQKMIATAQAASSPLTESQKRTDRGRDDIEAIFARKKGKH